MEATNIAEFNRDIRAFEKTVPDKIVTLQKWIVFKALRSLRFRTPVDTGRASGNWQTTIDNPAEGQLEDFDTTEEATMGRARAQLAGLTAGHIVWLTNNVTYIEYLENGTEKMAAVGMLATTVNDLRTMVKGPAA